jgi:hypothetical protein
LNAKKRCGKSFDNEDPHYHSYYKPENWKLIEASLTIDIEYSDDIAGLVFKIVETAEKLNEMRNKLEHLLKSMH